ncbi:ABC transporter ATP-binding protein [Lunatibacter salilacus]|uniref:ABC transporter ATP-binding protein n=1 Tax=Lunatibacter salilacus TaxID=2483804 RepID=UPI00131D532E|nr:ABC transporter ATP-binding protein [Lunatibacter salilacus]
MLKKFVKKYFYYFSYFYRFLGHRLLISFGLSMGVALMDGLGLTMFLPLLQMLDGGEGTGEGLGKLSFLVDGLEAAGIPLTILSVLLMMVVFFGIKGVFKFVETYYKVVVRQYFIQKLRYQNIDLIVGYSYKSFVLSDSGKIQNTLSGEMERVVGALSFYSNVVQAGAMVFVYTILALTVNIQFTLLVMVGGLLSNLLFSQLYKKTKGYSKKITSLNHGFQGLLIQKVAFFKYLKATGSLETFGKKLKHKISDIERSVKKIGLMGAAIHGFREPLIVIIVVGVILIETQLLGGSLSAIILSLLFFYRALTYLTSLQTSWNGLLTYHGSLENLKEFIAELRSGKDRQGKIKLDRFEKEMVFSNVGFSYNETVILNDISFNLPKNQTLALVGESGSGKTSLMNLMAGLALPDKGEILVDGVAMRELDRNSLQRQIGYITQEPVIFSDTVYNNVTFWDADTPENRQRCQAALEKAAVWAFVEGLPDQTNSLLGTNGIMVSGGQKQRISIARELYKEVDFLLMDEATSALDSETERVIQENIEALKGQYTIVIIAHRLSTVKNADHILLLQAGRIQQAGTFQDLFEHSGSFKKMVELQEF